MQTLYLTQYGCFIITTVLALLLVISRVHIRNKNKIYETSRWFLFIAMVLFAIHYLMQMIFGFRAMGDDVGALVNILFYAPAAYLFLYSLVRMTCCVSSFRYYTIVGIISYALILACFLCGWLYYESLHMPYAVYGMGIIFFLFMLYFVIAPSNEMHRTRKQIENETGSDIRNYKLYMRTGTILLFITAGSIPFAIFFTEILIVTAPFYIFTIFFYIISFIALGFHLSPVRQILEENSKTRFNLTLEEGYQQLKPERYSFLNKALEKWHAEKGFKDPDLNAATMAESLGVDKKELSQYIYEKYGHTFRIWLSNIRIEEVKKLLLSREDYSNETIAYECGFSSRTWLQQKFKASTGMTPNEWKNIQKQM